MDVSLLRVGFRRAIASTYNPAKRRILFQSHHHQRRYATAQEPNGPIRAAPPIEFGNDSDQFARPRAEIINEQPRGNRSKGNGSSSEQDQDYDHLLRRVRIVPASPSYFTATPRYTDDLLHLLTLKRRYETLPMLPLSQAPPVAWKTQQTYKTELGEPVRLKGYSILVSVLKRLNRIHPSLFPVEVQRTLERYKRDVQPHLNQPKPILLDSLGRTRAVGRRKSSHAVVFLVQGDGECLVNGKKLNEYFARLRDREYAVWALKATQRLDKYNVWCVARGGGTTGQAEAITLGLAKALLAQEPGLKPALRRAGVVTRDIRVVERKKAGKLKARKMPAWNRR